MRLTFTVKDAQEITVTAVREFVTTFPNMSDDISDSDSSDSYFDEFDGSAYGWEEITESVEEMVETYSEYCNPLSEVYGSVGAEVVKETITKATQCAGLNFFRHVMLVPEEEADSNLIESCTAVSYRCCVKQLRKFLQSLLKQPLIY